MSRDSKAEMGLQHDRGGAVQWATIVRSNFCQLSSGQHKFVNFY
jgi:hypothetical protein